ncbi:energy transducer TonB [Porphyrobacter sp. YT40]|uniref:energy transducer TonB n=1 Tax=Porphyrobacter sp. YT40 TaxID=2547601 RepID=UPI00114215CF|nr:energy transducer TonB [Porphyrobacter sp. YT40]QDH35975.1 energy transducer TonB [Porphyrobacter sp. YT40]
MTARLAIALLGLGLAAPALAGSDPVPRAPEQWVSSYWPQCPYHGCGGEGTVRFAVTVSPQGRVTACTILETSGDPRLDRESCEFLTRRARFEPARDDDGKPVEGRWESRIAWKIPDAPPETESPAG